MIRPAPAISYGEHPDQVANLHLPEGDGPFPCVMVIHGGFWRYGWDRTLMTPLAHDLAARGIAAWNAEYRRVGQEGGGWPGTLDDAAAALDHLATVPDVDAGRVVTLGHSAGGHLAVWLASGVRVAGEPVVAPIAAVGQGAVCDLVAASRDGLGSGAADALLGGGPDEVPERYAVASPARHAPLQVPVVLVHGADDDIVPPTQSSLLAGAELVLVPGAGHFEPIDPTHAAWHVVADRLPALLGLAA